MILRFVAVIVIVAASSMSAKPADTTYISPDRQLRAVVKPARPGSVSTETCLVDTYKADGALTGREGHSGGMPQVLFASWSPDSRFFVYTVTRISGLHRARPLTMVYVRESEYRFYDLEHYTVGAIADSKWSFRRPCYLRGHLVGRSGSVHAFEVDLSKIRWAKQT